MNYVIFDLPYGSILRQVDVLESDLHLNVFDCEGSLKTESHIDDECFYVEIVGSPKLVKKQEFTLFNDGGLTLLADGVDQVVFQEVPDGLFITWPDGVREEVTDGVVEFSVTQPGVYTLKFDGVKYLNKEVQIEATI